MSIFEQAAHAAQLLGQGQFEFLRARAEQVLGIEPEPATANEKAEIFQYVEDVLAKRPATLPEENLARAVESCEKGEVRVKHLPVMIEYSNTFTGCNIYPPCPKCFSNPKPKIEYTFKGNDFKGLESALEHADGISMGSIAELMFDPNYPAIARSMSADGHPRLVHPSNGILLARHYEHIAGNVRTIMLSMDAHTPEMYGKLQGKPGHFNLIQMGLRQLLKLKQERNTPYPLVTLSVVACQENIEHLKDIYDLFSQPEFGIDHFMVSRLGPIAEDKPGRFRGEFQFDYDKQHLPEALYAQRVRELREHAEGGVRVLDLIDFLTYFPTMNRAPLFEMKGVPCPIPWIFSRLSTTGVMQLCCYADVGVGNWRRDGFEKAWNGPTMLEVRQDMLDTGISRHCLDGNCPLLDRLNEVAEKNGKGTLLADLKKDWNAHASTARDLMAETCAGTSRSVATYPKPLPMARG